MQFSLLPRPGDLTLGLFFLGLLLFALVLAGALPEKNGSDWVASRATVNALGLTDLCLFTEARYTRHPSQADAHAPFQDHPQAQEHFPSGALLTPPPHLHAHAPLAR